MSIQANNRGLSSIACEPLVYIIVINYNGYDDTISCLQSLQKIRYQNYKALVIDNASTNDSVARIVSWMRLCGLPFSVIDGDKQPSTLDANITLIKSGVNRGFGGANNRAFQLALRDQVPYVLLLNNDTIVDEQFLSHMVATMSTADDIGIVGGKIYHMQERNKIWYCGGWIDYIRGAAYHDVKDVGNSFETTLVTGCLALVNMRAIREVGFFDERYFLNVEDWDLSYRMHKRGWKLIVDPLAIIFHKISGSIGGPYSLRNQYYFHRNRLLFMSSNLTSIKNIVFLFIQVSVVIPVWIVKQTFKGRFSDIRAFYLGTRDFLRGKFGKSALI